MVKSDKALYTNAMHTHALTHRPLIVGTRASPLARAQTEQFVKILCAAHGWAAKQVEIIALTTRGDAATSIAADTPPSEIGGKGVFTAELDMALLEGRIDFAVHSLKDLPTAMPDGLVSAATPPRIDPRDVLVPSPNLALDLSMADNPIAALPQAARIGTASLRRSAQLRALRGELQVAPVRGNIGTRLDKLAGDDWTAVILAAAGLVRLENWPPQAVALDPNIFVPAAGQGALGVQCRADNMALIDALAAVTCQATQICVTAERNFLAALDGSCRTPIAAHATLSGATLTLHGRLLAEDGSEMVEDVCQADATEASAATMGHILADRLRARAPHLVMD